MKDSKWDSGVMTNKESNPPSLILQIKALVAEIQQISSRFRLFTLSLWMTLKGSLLKYSVYSLKFSVYSSTHIFKKFKRRIGRLESIPYYTWEYNKSRPKRHLRNVVCIVYSCKKSWYSLRWQEKWLEAEARQFWVEIKGSFFNRGVLNQWT